MHAHAHMRSLAEPQMPVRLAGDIKPVGIRGHRVTPYGSADGIGDIVSGTFDGRRKAVRALGMMAVAVMLRWRR